MALLVIATLATSSCALHRPPKPLTDYGIPACPDGAERDVLAPRALQCWFDAPHGRWRVLNHQQHLEALVVEVEARDLRDSDDIARRIVAPVEVAYGEVLVYVQAEAASDLLYIRRVRWTRSTGFEALEFSIPRNSSTAGR